MKDNCYYYIDVDDDATQAVYKKTIKEHTWDYDKSWNGVLYRVTLLNLVINTLLDIIVVGISIYIAAKSVDVSQMRVIFQVYNTSYQVGSMITFHILLVFKTAWLIATWIITRFINKAPSCELRWHCLWINIAGLMNIYAMGRCYASLYQLTQL
jgi:hypothetical protein